MPPNLQSYRPDTNYRGTPRQTAASYFNAVTAIVMYGTLTLLSWTKGEQFIGRFPSTFLSAGFGFFFIIQVVGLFLECLGFIDQQNPVTGEWKTVPTGGDPRRLRHVRPD
jgi:hypothetical protein